MHKMKMFGRIREKGRKQLTGRERIQNNVKKEDFLIKQIDEFKEKAQQLQQLLDTKENRVQELQNIVDEREQKAKNLQEILQEKQLEADNITKGVEAYAKQIAQDLEKQITQLRSFLDEKQQGDAENLAQLKGFLDEKQQGETESVAQLAASVDALSGKIDTVKNELSEKVHTENVKCYRNMQTLVEEVEEELKTVELGYGSMKTIKGYMKAAVTLGVINLIAVLLLVLYECGVFNYIL